MNVSQVLALISKIGAKAQVNPNGFNESKVKELFDQLRTAHNPLFISVNATVNELIDEHAAKLKTLDLTNVVTIPELKRMVAVLILLGKYDYVERSLEEKSLERLTEGLGNVNPQNLNNLAQWTAVAGIKTWDDEVAARRERKEKEVKQQQEAERERAILDERIKLEEAERIAQAAQEREEAAHGAEEEEILKNLVQDVERKVAELNQERKYLQTKQQIFIQLQNVQDVLRNSHHVTAGNFSMLNRRMSNLENEVRGQPDEKTITALAESVTETVGTIADMLQSLIQDIDGTKLAIGGGKRDTDIVREIDQLNNNPAVSRARSILEAKAQQRLEAEQKQSGNPYCTNAEDPILLTDVNLTGEGVINIIPDEKNPLIRDCYDRATLLQYFKTLKANPAYGEPAMIYEWWCKGDNLNPGDVHWCRERGINLPQGSGEYKQKVYRLPIGNYFISEKSVQRLSNSRYVGFTLTNPHEGIVGSKAHTMSAIFGRTHKIYELIPNSTSDEEPDQKIEEKQGVRMSDECLETLDSIGHHIGINDGINLINAVMQLTKLDNNLPPDNIRQQQHNCVSNEMTRDEQRVLLEKLKTNIENNSAMVSMGPKSRHVRAYAMVAIRSNIEEGKSALPVLQAFVDNNQAYENETVENLRRMAGIRNAIAFLQEEESRPPQGPRLRLNLASAFDQVANEVEDEGEGKGEGKGEGDEQEEKRELPIALSNVNANPRTVLSCVVTAGILSTSLTDPISAQNGNELVSLVRAVVWGDIHPSTLTYRRSIHKSCIGLFYTLQEQIAVQNKLLEQFHDARNALSALNAIPYLKAYVIWSLNMDIWFVMSNAENLLTRFQEEYGQLGRDVPPFDQSFPDVVLALRLYMRDNLENSERVSKLLDALKELQGETVHITADEVDRLVQTAGSQQYNQLPTVRISRVRQDNDTYFIRLDGPRWLYREVNTGMNIPSAVPISYPDIVKYVEDTLLISRNWDFAVHEGA